MEKEETGRLMKAFDVFSAKAKQRYSEEKASAHSLLRDAECDFLKANAKKIADMLEALNKLRLLYIDRCGGVSADDKRRIEVFLKCLDKEGDHRIVKPDIFEYGGQIQAIYCLYIQDEHLKNHIKIKRTERETEALYEGSYDLYDVDDADDVDAYISLYKKATDIGIPALIKEIEGFLGG